MLRHLVGQLRGTEQEAGQRRDQDQEREQRHQRRQRDVACDRPAVVGEELVIGVDRRRDSRCGASAPLFSRPRAIVLQLRIIAAIASALTRGRTDVTPPARRPGSAAPRRRDFRLPPTSVSASDLTSPAVARASVLAPATRLMAWAPVCASSEARLTPSAIDDTAAFCSSTVTETVEAMADMSVMMALTCSIACAESTAADWMAPICSAISAVARAVCAGERFDLGGDHREAAAGFAGARGLDRGVERQQIGLAGDRLDQPDHLADAGGGAAELGHRLGGALRLGDGAARRPRSISRPGLRSRRSRPPVPRPSLPPR